MTHSKTRLYYLTYTILKCVDGQKYLISVNLKVDISIGYKSCFDNYDSYMIQTCKSHTSCKSLSPDLLKYEIKFSDSSPDGAKESFEIKHKSAL